MAVQGNQGFGAFHWQDWENHVSSLLRRLRARESSWDITDDGESASWTRGLERSRLLYSVSWENSGELSASWDDGYYRSISERSP